MWAGGKTRRVKLVNGAEVDPHQRTREIRSAARRGTSPTEIATLHRVPLSVVERILSKVDNPRVSDPIHLLTTRQALPGRRPVDVQLYWLGFLKAAGHIWGQGTHFTLVIVLGEKSLAHMKTFLADFADPFVQFEFCRSSLLGWQLYVRDQDLCRALIPWGIPSDLYGDDAGMLDDLPEEFAAPFMHGFLDGNWPPRRSAGGDGAPLTLHGPAATLGGINGLVQRCWRVAPGVITEASSRAKLHFASRQASRVIRNKARAHTSRSRPARTADAAGQDARAGEAL